MLDLDETRHVKYKPDLVIIKNRFQVKDGSKYKGYTESDQCRWLVKGRDLSGKIYLRHLCWDCFFKHLPEVEDIAQRSRKSKWYQRVLNGERPVPIGSTSPSKYFKLLFDITDDELNAERTKFDTASLDSFIRRHGEAEGQKKFEEYKARQAYTCSKEYMVNEKGMSESDWENYNSSRASTEENFIKRYGEDLGKIKWKDYCEYESYAGCTLEYFQNKYGNDIGKIKYYDVCHQKSITLSNFIKKYGNILGKEKYENMMHRKDGVGYSAISQRFFNEIDNILGDLSKDSKWALKNLEAEIEIELDNGIKKFAKPDYLLNNKIIEFNGDYWHANPIFYKSTDFISYPAGKYLASEIWLRDAQRLNAIKKLGYDIFIVWENEYNDNPIKNS